LFGSAGIMCTRFVLLKEHLRETLARLGLDADETFNSRYNIAPGSFIPAVRKNPRTAQNERDDLHWGLVPSWAKSDESATQLVNARAETLAAKPSFRDALRARRCVIPASGFYEWARRGRARQPWLFRRRDDQPFGLAGLWASWRAPDGSTLESCAVITTEPNELMRPIHDRMPAILAPEQFPSWLDPRVTDPAELAPLLRVAPAENLHAVAVRRYVSSVQHEGPECLVPADDEKEDAQFSLGLE
jgi:putative SOS response-associated peptidase YedK